MERKVWSQGFRQGDWVVFRRRKHTTRPGRHARDVFATANGDEYDYFVDKFWIVAEVLPDGKLRLQTRRGKTHVVDASDAHLRPASLWDRLRYRGRFTQLKLPEPREA
jgi:hypothetical protein